MLKSVSFQVAIIAHSKIIFAGIAYSVFVPGDEGEFEILAFHHPIISLLKQGNIGIDNINFPIHSGIMRFFDDKLVALVEM
ncbi:MAG: hypothetical protein ACE5GG_01590 [Candidatus Omnitrophota bacterium]